MKEFLTSLAELGFTPLNCILLGGIYVLWRMMNEKDAEQTKAREDWHTDTRKQVEELQGHVKACDDDRAQLRIMLSTRCTRTDCPLSPHAPIRPRS